MFHSIRRSTRAAALVVVAALVAPVAVALAPTAAGAAPVTAPFSYVGAPVAIPDGLDLTGTQPGAEATVDVTAGALLSPITDIDLRIDGSACTANPGATTVGITHTFVSDLRISLTSPAGTTVQLAAENFTNNPRNNLCQVVFDDEANSPFSYASGTPPFTGSFTPASPLSAFDGQNGNGTWTLTAQDFFDEGTGSIRAFSVLVTTDPVTATKTVAGDFEEGGTVTYTITASNHMSVASDDNPGPEITDTLPAGVSLVSAEATSGVVGFNVPTNTVTWNGAFPAAGGDDVVLTIEATVDEGTENETLANQATVNFDVGDDGTNESSSLSDDPDVDGAANPTSFTVDGVPTVTVDQASTQADPTGASPIIFDVTFSEPVTGFGDAVEDVDFTGGSAGGTFTAVVTGSGADYTIEVSGATGAGTVNASIPAESAVDATGNDNLASTSTDGFVTFNPPPVADDDGYTAAEDDLLEVAAVAGVLANDDDADDLEATVEDEPEHGDLTFLSDGSFDYDPDANYQGPDSFTYTANDGVSDSNVALVEIDVVSADDQPVAGNDSYGVGEDGVLSRTAATGVLDNDTDPDEDDLTAVLTVAPANGALTLAANGSFTYTPAANFAGTDAFVYVANDGGINSAPATVTITVAPTPGATRQQYVDDVFQVLLGRHADGPGAAFWSGQLAGGLSQTAFTNAVENSTEGIDTQIRRSYLALLDRGADPGGLAAWRGFLAGGGTTRMLEAQLVGSQEFLAGAGGTNAAFVAEAYRELLGREVDAGGATFWQNAIAAGTSRTAVAQALLDSNEGITRQLAAAYRLVLLRAPDAGAVSFAPVVRTGDRRFVLALLTASEEFFNLATVG